MWIAMVMRRWEDLELSIDRLGVGVKVKPRQDRNDPCIGCIPVFSTREAALDFMDGDASRIAEIGYVEPAPKEPDAGN